MTEEAAPLRVLLAEDSELFAETLTEILEEDGRIRIVGWAPNGQVAVRLARRLRPHLILMDVRMPVLDGLSAVRQIMAETPTPILVMTGDPEGRGGELPFRALECGALDLVPKPEAWGGTADERRDLRERVERLASVSVVRLLRPRGASPMLRLRQPRGRAACVVIGSSTGGPPALLAILSALPPPLPIPILIAQHLSSGFAPQLAAWLAERTGHDVRVAGNGERLRAGIVRIAPTDRQLVLDGSRLTLVDGDRTKGLPSADQLFESVAHSCGRAAIGVVLSGMGRDGAAGTRRLRERGAMVLAQDEASCPVFGMPAAARDAGAELLTLTEIARRLGAPAGVRCHDDG